MIQLCHVFFYSASLSNNGESISALDELFEESEDQESEGQKVKKTVRFSDKVHKQLFRYEISLEDLCALLIFHFVVSQINVKYPGPT